MSTKRVDNDAALGRAQLASRMRNTILQACGMGNIEEEQIAGKKGTATNVILTSNDTLSSNISITANEPLPVSTSKISNINGITLISRRIEPADEDVENIVEAQPKKNSKFRSDVISSSNESLPNNDALPSNISIPSNNGNTLSCNVSLPSNDITSNDALPCNEIIGKDSLPSNDVNVNETEPGNNSLLCNDMWTNNISLPNTSLPSNHSLPTETLPSNTSLLVSLTPIYGEPIKKELLFAILNTGIYALLAKDNASASMLFYWAFTTQQRAILFVTYSQVQKHLGYSKPRISRTLDSIRENTLFSVKTTPKGIFMDISSLIKEAEKMRQFQDRSSNDPLPAYSSSSILNDIKTTTNTTSNISNESLLALSNIKSSDIRILVDIITFYGYSCKDISPKIIDIVAQIYKNRGLFNVAFNMAYASKNNKRVGSPTGYLLKTLTEDYGGTSLPYDDMERSKNTINIFTSIREGSIDDFGTSELRKTLYSLGHPLPENTPRSDCESAIKEILSKSDDLHKKITDLMQEYSNKGINPFLRGMRK
ncbi:MAG: hypothetical protein LBQ43_00675 [Holosporales bacterium]|jgi:hypothetical protein|nr:hypothetical protein [Holosporales bacterium]